MKLLAIGDLIISDKLMGEIFSQIKPFPAALKRLCWTLKDKTELQRQRMIYEEKGPGAIRIPEKILKESCDSEILMVHFFPVSKELIFRSQKLRIIGVARAGLENIDLEAANQHGILVFNVKGRNAEAVSDFTIGLILAELRNIARSHLAIMKGGWRKEYLNSGFMGVLKGKTVGIIGYGEIGKLVARKLKGFGVNTLVYDPFVSEIKIREDGFEPVDLKKIFIDSDFVTVHARLTDDNKGFIGREQIFSMKKTAFFINTARAGLVDNAALIQALRKRIIGGAALDVFENEPLPENSPLRKLDNITLTSHLAGVTQDTYKLSVRILLEDIGRFLKREPPRNLVNKEISLSPSLKTWLSEIRNRMEEES
jgi:D-3-phosphoglycerate dehydrogenase